MRRLNCNKKVCSSCIFNNCPRRKPHHSSQRMRWRSWPRKKRIEAWKNAAEKQEGIVKKRTLQKREARAKATAENAKAEIARARASGKNVVLITTPTTMPTVMKQLVVITSATLLAKAWTSQHLAPRVNGWHVYYALSNARDVSPTYARHEPLSTWKYNNSHTYRLAGELKSLIDTRVGNMDDAQTMLTIAQSLKSYAPAERVAAESLPKYYKRRS